MSIRCASSPRPEGHCQRSIGAAHQKLDAPVEIPRHESALLSMSLGSAVSNAENTEDQESTDNRSHANGIAHAGHDGSQDAHPTNDRGQLLTPPRDARYSSRTFVGPGDSLEMTPAGRPAWRVRFTPKQV